MAAGVELTAGRATGGGIAMEFPAGDDNSCLASPRLPRRLRRRFHDVEGRSPRTVEDIEAKLRDADLRRQKHYEELSSKARPKPRSPSRSSSQEENLGRRLEAKLQAAEQKRLSILAKDQMRLARLDELRQAAKTGAKMRYENERAKLGTKVESRVQQAEANRMLMLKAHRQRRVSLGDRSSQSLLRRMARESKYKECVRAAINQKRVAAETKRLELLEAEKNRAHARVLQVRHVAKSVSNQREIERRKMKDQLEDRLQRAKRQRAEYLRQRGRLLGYVREDRNRVPKQAEVLSRKLARCWRKFLSLTKTTFALAKAYDALGINQKSVKSMPFEQLALLIESVSTIHTVKALLDRIERRLQVSRAVTPANHLSSLDNIDHLLKRVATPKKVTPRSSTRSRETKRVSSVKESNRNPARLSRYPVRVVLCAYMILGHPDAVFSGMGEREISLARSAEEFVQMFELLVKIILEGPILSSDEESHSAALKRFTFKSQLAAFDRAWCSYLNWFVVWKVKDAQLLEKDLVRAACQLEASMIQTCNLTPEGDNDKLTYDMKAIQHQVSEGQRLLREKVLHLSGDAGIERMESALSETRSKFFKANESTSTSPVNVPPALSTVASSTEINIPVESNQKSSHVVRSLFNEYEPSLPGGSSFSADRINLDGQLGSSDEKLVTENELFVNEFLHERQHSFSDGLGIADHYQNSIEGKIKQTMEKAFWDSIMESINQEQPNYVRVVQLLKEVRDEICEMAPQNWKEDILSAIDLDIFSQVLQSGNLDVDYLGKILEFSLVTLQKLSAPANEETMKAKRQNLFLELNEISQLRDESKNSCVIALIKGLQFVLEQTQILKKEISKARIRLMEPLLKGPAGLDYLKNSFANRYGPPSDANTSLPSTLRWLSSVWTSKDQDWEEHLNFSSSLASGGNSSSQSQGCLPSTTLRTGGSILSKATGTQMTFSADDANTTGDQLPECNGELIDLVVRLGLLKLVSGISGLTQDDLPETLSLNLFRLRSVQSQIQRIIVISTGILICRQILVSEKAVGSTVEMESIVWKCAEKLEDLLDHDQDVDVDNIVEVICDFSAGSDIDIDAGKLQRMKVVAARMLPKSLQAGDAVFDRVSNAVYSAVRGIMLGGNGVQGRKLVEMALRKVGAGLLIERVVKAAEVLIVAASISVSVHGPWYQYLTDNMNK